MYTNFTTLRVAIFKLSSKKLSDASTPWSGKGEYGNTEGAVNVARMVLLRSPSSSISRATMAFDGKGQAYSKDN